MQISEIGALQGNRILELRGIFEYFLGGFPRGGPWKHVPGMIKKLASRVMVETDQTGAIRTIEQIRESYFRGNPPFPLQAYSRLD